MNSAKTRPAANRAARPMLLALVMAMVPASSRAALLMEERFDGPGYDLGATELAGLNGGVGFGGAWENNGNGLREITAGLAFSDYPVSGNAITYNPRSFIPGDRRDIGDFSLPAPGAELWVSFLARLNFGQVMGNTVIVSRGGTGDLAFQLGLNSGSPPFGLVAVDDSAVAGNAPGASSVVLLIAKFTNFGLGSPANPQLGTFWALSDANYDAIKIGGITESELIANNIATATDMATAPTSYSTTSVVAIGAGSGSVASFTIDELRYATDLRSAVVVPEPASLALLGLCGLSLLLRRRR